VRLRHKIEKASAAKQKKARKLAKKVRKAAHLACTHMLMRLGPDMEKQDEERARHS
jgi:hypothetical protein